MFSIDMVHILVRLFVDPGPGFGQEVFAFAVFQGTDLAGFSACRFLPFLLTLSAEIAFADQRENLIPLVLGDIERARCHAVTASNAYVIVVDYRTFGCFLQRANRAG